MNEQCTDCIHIKNLDKEINEVKCKIVTMEADINTVKFEAGINKEQTKMVFNILNEIKGSIEKIANKIEDMEKRPSNLLYTIGGGITIAIATYFITK